MSRPRPWLMLLASTVLASSLVFIPIQGRAQGSSWLERLPARHASRDLASAQSHARTLAARVLGHRGDASRASAVLATALGRERAAGTRAVILDSLARRAEPRWIPALVSVMGGPSPRDATIAAYALAAIGNQDAMDALVDALANARTAPAALAGLERAGEAAITPLLTMLRTARGGAASARGLARFALAGRRAAQVRAALRQAARADEASLRAAALGALAPAARTRDEPLYVRALDDESEEVVAAALGGLARIASPRAWPPLSSALAGAGHAERPLVLRAMLASDPAAIIRPIQTLWASEDLTLRGQALDVALLAQSPALLSLYAEAWAAEMRRGDVAAALIALPRGAGLAMLLGSEEPMATRELAVALRGDVSGPVRAAALARIRARPPDVALTLRALARDATVLPELERGLASSVALVRARTAQACGLLGDERALQWLLSAITRERSALAFRALARAATDLGGGLSAGGLALWLEDPETAPEAMALGALASARPRDRSFRRQVRRALRSPSARVRAGAARALALMDDRRARPALRAALEDERPEVRVAVASALRALGDDGPLRRLMALRSREPAPEVYSALQAIVGAAPGAYDDEGDDVLRVGIGRQELAAAGILAADVVLRDGRWLRVVADSEGELYVVDLPPGQADVRVRLAPPSD